jgi:hypothetical protein
MESSAEQLPIALSKRLSNGPQEDALRPALKPQQKTNTKQKGYIAKNTLESLESPYSRTTSGVGLTAGTRSVKEHRSKRPTHGRRKQVKDVRDDQDKGQRHGCELEADAWPRDIGLWS